MEIDVYEFPVHRPHPQILVGFTKKDYEMAKKVIADARAYMLERTIGNDGLTDEDRKRIEHSRRIVFDWKEIAKMAKEADTKKGRTMLKEEMIRAYENLKIQRKLQYKDNEL